MLIKARNKRGKAKNHSWETNYFLTFAQDYSVNQLFFGGITIEKKQNKNKPYGNVSCGEKPHGVL